MRTLFIPEKNYARPHQPGRLDASRFALKRFYDPDEPSKPARPPRSGQTAQVADHQNFDARMKRPRFGGQIHSRRHARQVVVDHEKVDPLDRSQQGPDCQPVRRLGNGAPDAPQSCGDGLSDLLVGRGNDDRPGPVQAVCVHW